MEYKEYKAAEGKALLDLASFNHYSAFVCGINTKVNFIEVSIADAEYFNNLYETYKLDSYDSGMSDEEIPTIMYNEIQSKGYNIDNKVEPIIHN